ncbi:hypothetical protein ACFYYH_02900 [Streptomyces sp. NPDC002018]|uniref:hypothetical protein n=1 Tax=Streptomyces sp. NPDC002018 TaxID=3364629 RepID=UPI003677AC8D
MTRKPSKQEDRPAKAAKPKPGPQKIGNLEVWARSAPIRLAGYEDDLAEPHILPGID